VVIGVANAVAISPPEEANSKLVISIMLLLMLPPAQVEFPELLVQRNTAIDRIGGRMTTMLPLMK